MISDWDTEIRDASDEHDLPYGLIKAIVEHESSGNPCAYRYEPRFKSVYLDGKTWKRFGNTISYESEVIGRATSYGLMQIMGQTARERGFAEEFMTELCKPTKGLYWGCRHLKHLESRYFIPHGWAGVISSYNAGSPRFDTTGAFVNAEYVDKVQKTWTT